MIKHIRIRILLSLTLFASLFMTAIGPAAFAQTPAVAQQSDLQKSLATLEERLEKRRQELGIPGLSLVIVKDGAIIYAKGLGYKDFENKVPVTTDTQFAIGSATKAFTALTVLMSADEGKVDLDASPKKYLPYFKMYDPDTDKNMTVRDLMDHSSGLNRTDLAMITGKLNRVELIRVAGEAKPMAKLREKFFYQNIMFAAAGEVAAAAQKKSFEQIVVDRIFKPLGMTNSNISVKDFDKSKDHSFGYEYNFDTKETRKLPYRSIDDVSAAGAINSSANDMAKWLNFVLDGGVAGGRRLISEKNYEEWLKPQMKITPNGKMSYGLGWFLQEWNGMKVVQHGGNIDGFNSMVAMIPEKKLGFVLLTNVSASSLGGDLMPVVWSTVLGDPNKPQTVAASELEKEVGKYKMEAAGIELEVRLEDGKLVLIVPGQPKYQLENVGPRKYKMIGAPDGFFATFKEDSMYLEQPQGNFTLPKNKTAPKNSEAAKELIGSYKLGDTPNTAEIKGETDGRVTLNIEGQPPYALLDKATDEFSLAGLPASFMLKVKRTEGKATGFVVVQPQGDFEFTKLASDSTPKPTITIDELMAKAIDASGGETNWRKITTREIESDIDFVNQGVKAKSHQYYKAPGMTAAETSFFALGKPIGNGWEYFNGTVGAEAYSFAPVETYSGKKLEDVRLNSLFYALLDWKKNFKTVELKGSEKVGDEDCWVVEFSPEKGSRFTNVYSKSTFLLLRRRGVVPSSTSSQNLPFTYTYSDYRDVDGIKLPFKTVNDSISMGEVIETVKSVKHNVELKDSLFADRSIAAKK